jgi:hypothetical protein
MFGIQPISQRLADLRVQLAEHRAKAAEIQRDARARRNNTNRPRYRLFLPMFGW